MILKMKKKKKKKKIEKKGSIMSDFYDEFLK